MIPRTGIVQGRKPGDPSGVRSRLCVTRGGIPGAAHRAEVKQTGGDNRKGSDRGEAGSRPKRGSLLAQFFCAGRRHVPRRRSLVGSLPRGDRVVCDNTVSNRRHTGRGLAERCVCKRGSEETGGENGPPVRLKSGCPCLGLSCSALWSKRRRPSLGDAVDEGHGPLSATRIDAPVQPDAEFSQFITRDNFQWHLTTSSIFSRSPTNVHGQHIQQQLNHLSRTGDSMSRTFGDTVTETISNFLSAAPAAGAWCGCRP